MIPEKTNKAIFTAVSTYCPEKFLGHNAETGYPNTAQQSFRFEKTKIDFEETKAASMCWNKIPKGGSRTEKALKICRKVLCSSVFGWEPVCVCMRGNNAKDFKKTPDKSVQNNYQSSHRAGNSSFSHQPDWKDVVLYGTLTRILRRISP